MTPDTSRAPEILRPQDPGVRLLLPIRIESCANLREHWAKRAGRAKEHRMAALAVPRHPLPCVVTITRIAPRKLDDDNLAGGCKALRDGIADRLGVDDGSPLVQWRYDQRKGMPKQYAVEVVIAPMERERVAPELFGGAA